MQWLVGSPWETAPEFTVFFEHDYVTVTFTYYVYDSRLMSLTLDYTAETSETIRLPVQSER